MQTWFNGGRNAGRNMRCRRWIRSADNGTCSARSRWKPSKNYMNRKGFFALHVQAFCGAHTNFWYFCVGWPSATNDITAYKQTSLHHNSTNKDLPTSTPKWASFLLDEAYSSIGGCHLIPNSQHQLKKALLLGEDRKTLYFKMRTFNHVLFSQRITIERAFRQLVRRWGILWCANSSRLKDVSLMVQCCAKLHNVCVERWVKDGRRTGFTDYNEVEIIPEHVNVDIGTLPTDEDAQQQLPSHQQLPPHQQLPSRQQLPPSQQLPSFQ
jgi:DDE superfamily endonuclease